MTNKYLSRDDAPIEAGTWEAIDGTMRDAATSILTGRRILHIDGPYGLGLKAVPLSDPEVESLPVTSPVMPLALISRSFTIAKRDLAAFERDGIMLDTKPVAAAAIECAKLEDELVFKGTKDTAGLLTAKGSNQLKLSPWSEVGTAAEEIIKAVTVLDASGFHGPYSLALTPGRYNLLLRRYPDGAISELEHVRTIVTDGIFKAPALESGGILLASGRQFASIVLGQDMTAGFIGPVAERLEFSISESLTPFIRQPKAICLLKD
ncbi:MAG: family 1 encapsulin nanocompartment shell protein [Dehalococcoidales bacterium]|nr:family 1 encapsulin nanocompartment shell protein [Dehalococcoidales bacterium]